MSLVGGWSKSGSDYHCVGDPSSNVMVVGWNQTAIELSILNAEANRLVVVKTLRVEDNVETTL